MVTLDINYYNMGRKCFSCVEPSVPLKSLICHFERGERRSVEQGKRSEEQRVRNKERGTRRS